MVSDDANNGSLGKFFRAMGEISSMVRNTTGGIVGMGEAIRLTRDTPDAELLAVMARRAELLAMLRDFRSNLADADMALQVLELRLFPPVPFVPNDSMLLN